MADKKGAAVNETDDVVRDTKADEQNISDKDQMESRRSDIVWFGTGIHLPYDNDKAKEHIPLERRQRRRRPTLLVSKDSDRMTPVEEDRIVMAPSARVQQLLNQQKNGDNLEWQPSHSLFTEMEFLYGTGPNQEWRETARWVKYEEDVEEGGNRWSKPHVATLSLHSLFELRSCLMNGVVILDVEATELETVIEYTISTLLSEGLLKQSAVNTVREALLSKHKHQYEQNKAHKEGMSSGQSFLQTVRSIADIGRSLSHAKSMTPTVVESSAVSQIPAPVSPTALNVPDTGLNKLSGTALSAKQGSRVMDGSDITAKGNYHLYKKLPRGAEASNVLVGQLSSLDNYISAFIRLNKACHFNNLTEVPVPTRFMFILLGPEGHKMKYREIGRAISTLMSDEVFCDVAYQARNREDLLDGIDEFLEQVIVLPPGEWDPKIRIEPPTSVPSQEARKKLVPKKEDAHGSQNNNIDDDISGGHGKDIALKRTHKLFGGLMADIKRKIPWYASDFKDAFNLQCVAAFLYMYFAMLAPIVTFGGLLEEATDRNLAAIENLFSGAICGTLYSLFAGQPLTMIGSTGPVLIFERVVFDLCKKASLDFLSVRFWINTWSGVILLIIVAFDASAMVSYITRFTEESFSALISFIFIYESIAKLIKILQNARIIKWNPLSATGVGGNCSCSGKPFESAFMDDVKSMISRRRMNASSWLFHQPDENISYIDWDNVPLEHCEYLNGQLTGDSCYYMLDVFLMSLVLLAGTFTIAMVLKRGRNSSYFPTSVSTIETVRTILSDFAVFIAISLMILLDYFVGLQTPKLYVPENFSPTLESRSWIVHPLPDPSTWWIIPLGIAPAVLLCILLFMDHQITVVIVNRKENKLKKGCGYHLDLLLIATVCFITAFMGLPIFVAATVMSVSHVNALRVESECRAPGEKPKFIGVREQRVTGTLVFLFIGFSTLMTSILKHIPMPVLYGVFLYMGVSSLSGVQMVDRLLLLFMPMKYQPDYIYLRHVPIRRVHLFTFFQITCFIIMCVVKEVEVTSVAFPLMLVVLVAVRKLLEYVFTEKELKLLDDQMPEITLRKREDAKKKRQKEQQEEANKLVPVQTTSNLHIPLSSGHVMSIPLESLNPEEKVNLSEEVNRSGLWKHIASNMKKMKINDQKELKTFAEEEDDSEAITISFDRAEETPSTEKKPLLNDTEPPNENDEISQQLSVRTAIRIALTVFSVTLFFSLDVILIYYIHPQIQIFILYAHFTLFFPSHSTTVSNLFVR
ncbi:Sodium-driven chloride bicarbonate exchanger [Trichinella nelsoni]|uniref:Anion exchange protein n=1 Tax=Trichinella nelsoni TaxID=6336 RepID=A0A0V0S5R9_9BILA|nr:Sodium-driven chloride bicarbonate exchanger [Trichinella nelsoni]